MNQNDDRIRFCAKYLIDNGVAPEVYKNMYDTGAAPQHSYEIVPLNEDFFEKAAQGLWNLWPKGKKDGKFDWKESVPVLRERLMFIWKHEKVKEPYTVDDVLEAARVYIAQFEHSSVKYMQLLKYFIFKKKEMAVDDNGLIKVTYESTLLKMLQNRQTEEKQGTFEDFVI
jgi:hypothetical protein